MSIEEIEAEALELDPQARARLAEKLLESLETLSDQENERLWVEEADRRDADWDEAPGSARPAADVLRDARAKLGSLRLNRSNSQPTNFKTAIQGCLRNGQRLVEDAELLRDFDRHPTAFAVAILAQEEFAKAFILVLASEGVVPWTPEMRELLHSHDSKHLVGVLVEWLGPPWEEQERRLEAWVDKVPSQPTIPHDVAVAINILRHEKIERIRTGYAWPDPEDNGLARKIAKGSRDRAKQRALYVGIAQTGRLESLPTRVIREEATVEVERAKQYGEFADAAFGDRVLSFDEYRLFKEVMTAVFADLDAKPRTE